jgi:ethanolamine ammonia-lyase large subunit
MNPLEQKQKRAKSTLDEDDLLDSACGIIHIIGERPGSGHHTFSAYITIASRRAWSMQRVVDHDITRVVSGIADTSYDPIKAATETSSILSQMRSALKRHEPPPVTPPPVLTFSRPQKM